MLTIDTIPLKLVKSGEWRVESGKNFYSPLSTHYFRPVICFLYEPYGNGNDGKTF